jgi:hypothetical protein
MTSMDSRALASHGRRVAGPQPTLWDRVSKNLRILLANSKFLSFSILIFGPAQERLD